MPSQSPNEITGDYSSAENNFGRSLSCWRIAARSIGDRRAAFTTSANVVKVRGDYPRARAALREATEIFEDLGDRSGAAWSTNQLGDIAREQGDLTAAGSCIYGRFRHSGKPVTSGALRAL